MAIKWQSTVVTTVKWNTTNVTKVIWGPTNTVVFPDSTGYNGSSFADPIASGFTLWRYGGYDLDTNGKKKDCTSGGLNHSYTNIGKVQCSSYYRWISRNALNFTPYSKIIMVMKYNYYNIMENSNYWYACYANWNNIVSCNSNVQSPTTTSFYSSGSSSTYSGKWPDGEYPARNTWYDITLTLTFNLGNTKPTSGYLGIEFSIGRNSNSTNGSTGTFYFNITSIKFQ